MLFFASRRLRRFLRHFFRFRFSTLTDFLLHASRFSLLMRFAAARYLLLLHAAAHARRCRSYAMPCHYAISPCDAYSATLLLRSCRC